MTVPPRRLLDSVPQSREEQLLAAHLRAVPAPAPLSEEATARIARRLAAAPRPALWQRRVLWGFALAAPLAFAAAWLSRPTEAPLAAVEVVEADPAPAPVEVARVEPPVAPSEVAAPAVPARRRKVAPPPPPSPAKAEVEPETPAIDPLLEEAGLLRSALTALRTERDGVTALSILDGYDARFPAGQLRAEATVARVDALLVLGRGPDALAALTRLSVAERARLPRGEELGVLEAELLAQVGRCGEAQALVKHRERLGAALSERALFVDATCEARAQRTDRARTLFEELLRRFPQGAKAPEARRALGISP